MMLCADVNESVVLQAMRKGLLDVLPKNALEDLTAEDFRLLVNGCGEVNVQMLISFTSFNDESGTTSLYTRGLLFESVY